MSRYFIENGAEVGGIVTISGEDFHHIKNVLRKRLGDTLDVCDGGGMEYVVSIKRIYKDCIEACVEEAFVCDTESSLKLTLYQGLPKGDKMELIIQKCVELGVSKIVPVITERCVVKLDEDSAKKKTARWQKIAFEAAKQSNRGVVPTVSLPISYKEAVQLSKNSDLSIIPYEKEVAGSLKKAISSVGVVEANKEVSVDVFIGPEGGFEEAEIEFATENDILPVSLGPRILRTETAGMAVIAIIMYELGDGGGRE
jgi:16S rRNA (uracil1498-N3)-methyltransferase